MWTDRSPWSNQTELILLLQDSVNKAPSTYGLFPFSGCTSLESPTEKLRCFLHSTPPLASQILIFFFSEQQDCWNSTLLCRGFLLSSLRQINALSGKCLALSLSCSFWHMPWREILPSVVCVSFFTAYLTPWYLAPLVAPKHQFFVCLFGFSTPVGLPKALLASLPLCRSPMSRFWVSSSMLRTCKFHKGKSIHRMNSLLVLQLFSLWDLSHSPLSCLTSD